jgi:hypothetical protein
MFSDEYSNVLLKKLKKYRKVKVPVVSEHEARYILADLISRGYKVRYEDGFFILEDHRGQQ